MRSECHDKQCSYAFGSHRGKTITATNNLAVSSVKKGQRMSDSTSILGQMGYPMMFSLLAVVLVASGLFYSASKKFVRYFKRRQEQDAVEGKGE